MKPLCILGVIGASVLATGCSSGPPPIKPGSPAFFWAVAKESYRTGDLLKTDATLLELGRTENEFGARARTWQLVVSAGVAQGLWELADAYQDGSRISPARLRNEAASLRSLASNTALEFTQAVHNEILTNPKGPVRFAFGFPPGTVARPPDLAKVAAGIWLGDSEREALRKGMLQRGVIEAVSAAVGSPGDPAMALGAFQRQDVQIAREIFFYEMAKLLYAQSGLFDAKHLDRPERLAVMCREALAALRAIPETEETLALGEQIQKTLKKLGGAEENPITG